MESSLLISPADATPGKYDVRSGPLRVGVLLDSLTQPAWVHRTLDRVRESGVAEIVLAVVRDPMGAAEPPPQLDRVLYEAYERFDERWFRDDRSDPLQLADLRPLLEGIQQLSVVPGAAGEPIPEHAAALIRGQDLDVLLRLGFPHPGAGSRSLARYGVWSYHLGDFRDHLGGPPAFWELAEGATVIGSGLHVDGERPGEERVIYRSYATTSRISLWKNRREYYWKSAAFAARKLRDLHDAGPSAMSEPPGQPTPYTHRLRSVPTPSELLRVIPRVASRYVSLQLTLRTSFDQWFIAYRLADREPTLDGVPDRALYDFKPLVPPRDRLWADPFAVRRDGRHYILLEELPFARNKGHISVIEFDSLGRPSRPEPILQTDAHLSYPFVFDWRGESFLISESARAGDRPSDVGNTSVPIYRSREFPGQWEQEGAILEGLEVFDPTMVEIEGTWWLFCTRAEPGASTWDELHLFHAPTPFGPWRAHRRNPVKSDVRSSRPAGRLFQSGGCWFRPAQDCSAGYGYALCVNRIVRLTPSEFEEVEVSRIDPTWRPQLIGTHTLNAAGRLTVIDGRLRRRRWSRDAPPLPERPAR